MRIRQAVAGVVIAFITLLGVNIVTSAPAQASTTYVYNVYHYQVCQRQGHWGASLWNPWDPRSWYCYDLSIPLGITWAGKLDINGWCKATHRGSHAELTSNDAWGWRCIKRVR
jgi:hypothetical protein